MATVARLLALFVIWLGTAAAWWVLSAVMTARTHQLENDLSGAVDGLWGTPLEQAAPALSFEHVVTDEQTETLLDDAGRPRVGPDGRVLTRVRRVPRTVVRPEALSSSDLAVQLALDPRRKGLIWFALYDVTFDGAWTWTHAGPEEGVLVVRFPFPRPDGVYDDFRLVVDDRERWDVVPQNGQVEVRVPVVPGQTVSFGAAYRSRGRDQFVYRPNPDWQVGQVTDFRLKMTTDFDGIDFPGQTLSPSGREDLPGPGWQLDWNFRRLITGQAIGMVMPQRIQPGPLAAAMAFSAPISLGLYMLWIWVLGLIRRVEVHPVNHLFLAGAFFAFHLLFGYSADHLPVEGAFALSAVVSLGLTTSYLRLVTGAGFALREAGVAQLLYLVGFALAHFFDGFTGLTVTVLGVVTLFALMQLTGRIRWSEVFATGALDQPTR